MDNWLTFLTAVGTLQVQKDGSSSTTFLASALLLYTHNNSSVAKVLKRLGGDKELGTSKYYSSLTDSILLGTMIFCILICISSLIEAGTYENFPYKDNSSTFLSSDIKILGKILNIAKLVNSIITH